MWTFITKKKWKRKKFSFFLFYNTKDKDKYVTINNKINEEKQNQAKTKQKYLKSTKAKDK